MSTEFHLLPTFSNVLCPDWAGYLRNIDLICYGINSIILYKLRYYSINIFTMGICWKYFHNFCTASKPCFSSFICQFFVEVEGQKRIISAFKCPSPELTASYPSYLWFAWVSKFIWTGFKRPLTSGLQLFLRRQKLNCN